MEKSRTSHNLITDEGIAAWVAENEPGGMQKLADACEAGRIGGIRRTMCLQWLRKQQAEVDAAAQVKADELYLREVAAAERSASATEESAGYAKSAARWAKWSMLIALAALFVAVWPMIKDIGR